MTRLLVSVRSAEEATAAIRGGAAVIDIKEPDRGPLGRADVSVWRQVRRVVPPEIALSVALGELSDWNDLETPEPHDFSSIEYRKLGLAKAPLDWAGRWARLRDSLGKTPSWVAVVYSDWDRALAPTPEAILDEVLTVPECSAILVDTWSKREPSTLGESWRPWIERARQAGKKIVLAGGLDLPAIVRLAPLSPDYFAVRGAVCRGGDRRSTLDVSLVAEIARVVQRL